MAKEQTCEVYSSGIIAASVCSDMSIEEMLEQVNISHPTGVSSRWALSEDKAFKCGTPNPAPCSHLRAGCKHYLLVC